MAEAEGDIRRWAMRGPGAAAPPAEGAADWPALEALAASMRRLNRAAAGRVATDDDVRAVIATVDALSDRLEARPQRSKEADMAAVLGAATALHAPPPPEVGGSMEFDPFGAGGGRFHPASVDVAFVRDGDESVAATATVDGMFQGPPGRVHGGIVALLLDEVMSAVNRATGRRAYTVRLTVNLRAPAPIDTELTFRAWLDGVDGRKLTVRGEGRSAQGVFAEADGLFIMVSPPG